MNYMEYRIPPHSIDAEQSVIGAILLDNDVFTKQCRHLVTEDFYDKQNAEIYEAMKELSIANKPIDIITVSDAIGGIDYLAKVATNLPTTANAKHYIDIVKAKSLRRQYIKAGSDIVEMAMNGEYESMTDFKNDVLSKIDINVVAEEKKCVNVADTLMGVIDNIEKRYAGNEEHALRYGMRWLDSVTGGLRNELTYVAARPSIGKSALALQIAINLCRNGKNVAMFNLEMDKEQITERIVANCTGLQLNKIRNPKHMNENEFIKLSQGLGDISSLKLKIFDDIFKVEEIRSVAKELKLSKQLDFVIVDYLQLCDTNKKTNGANERVTHLSRQMKLMQKELRIPVWCLSQLSRTNEKDNRRPKLIDLRDSGSIEQDADNVLFLHDENYGNYAQDGSENIRLELIIAKQRQGQRDIFTDITFYPGTQKFYD